jgi:hypothetical protein
MENLFGYGAGTIAIIYMPHSKPQSLAQLEANIGEVDPLKCVTIDNPCNSYDGHTHYISDS